MTWGVVMRTGWGGVSPGRQCPEGSDTHLPPLPPVCLCLCLCLGHPKLMCELGNVVINQIYEARVEAMAVKKPGPTCSR